MTVSSTIKSLTVAAAATVALATGSVAFAQTSSATAPVQKQNDSAVPMPPSGTTGKAPAQRSAEKGMSGVTPTPTTSATAPVQKQNDSAVPMPPSATGGKTTAERDAEKAKK